MGESYCEQNYWQMACSNGGVSGWVHHNQVLSIGADVLICLAATALLGWLLWYLLSYRRRPFCVDCQKESLQVRTTDYDDATNEPVCFDHLLDRREARAKQKAETEPAYDCLLRHGKMSKAVVQVEDDFIVVDRCPKGCQFTDADETSRLTDQAYDQGYDEGRGDGQSSGMVIGIAAGTAINAGR